MGLLKTLLLFSALLAGSTSAVRLPTFLSRKRGYTPLVMFTGPADVVLGSDKMEKAIRQVEKELGVRVERMDICRNDYAAALKDQLTRRPAPYLYHRESCQVVFMTSEDGQVDIERVRTWAKGRLLRSSRGMSGSKSSAPTVVSQEDDTAMDQEELLEAEGMTPMQQRGMEAINKRTEEKIEESRRRKE